MTMSRMPMAVYLLVASTACVSRETPCRSGGSVHVQGTPEKVTTTTTDSGRVNGKSVTWSWVLREELLPASQTTEMSTLALRLTAIQCTPQEILAKVALHNRSKNWLWVRTASASGMGPSLSFTVSDTNAGVRIEQSAKSGHVSALTDYIVLSPDGELSRLVPVLRRFGAAANGGIWKIAATYRDTNVEVPVPPEGTRWFSGELESDAIIVSIPQNVADTECKIVSQ